jgi:hypothetical protein
MTTPSIVPDIGIVASGDIVAAETASLDLIKTENLLKNSLPKGRELVDNHGHLFERLFSRDPYMMVKSLEKLYGGSSRYTLEEVR